ncbi:uncharacterized protein F5147DRAFT_633526 [Suillus discolor]|uniref:Uncharacterized protein n=1 Tax=Suillus discolor TaxID=1912936 RepID=A0A9P7FBJ0_9AGAM|nr:uncharacterized protein F5147DRAFT_633526 [Suillus discolor]KAG2111308.1 hypothetical protein F5147DRAFT_633526 [Suillus discolor]
MAHKKGSKRPTPAVILSDSDSDSSSQSSGSGDDSSSSDIESIPSPQIKAKPRKEARKHAKKVAKKGNRGGSHESNSRRGTSPRDQCLHIARWIPRGIDMFCSLRDVFCTANLVRQDEAPQDLSEPEDEAAKKERKEMLAHLTKDVQEHHMNTFQRIVLLAPHLGVLARGNKKQRRELDRILAEMQDIIGQIRSEDASHLKPFIGRYAAADPDNNGLHPPIYSDHSKSRARMGMNHPQLAGMLCPIKHMKSYQEKPRKVQAQLQNGEIKVHASVWPALAYAGDPPGKDFDPDNVQEGFLQGYLLK